MSKRIRQGTMAALLGAVMVLTLACKPAPSAYDARAGLSKLGVKSVSCSTASSGRVTCKGTYGRQAIKWGGTPNAKTGGLELVSTVGRSRSVSMFKQGTASSGRICSRWVPSTSYTCHSYSE